jgi:hypothetical protein
MPRLVPNRKRAQSDPPVDEETDDSSHPPAVAHPNPHTRLRILENFNYYRGDELLGRFFKGEYANASDPLVIKAWADYPSKFEAEFIS